MNESKSVLYKSVRDITKRLNKAMQENARLFKDYIEKNGKIKGALFFYKMVRSGGDWDLKSQEEWGLSKEQTYIYMGKEVRFDAPGNIHYGYVGSVMFNETILVVFAGGYQIKSGTSNPLYSGSFYDDPYDTEMIRYGINLYYGGLSKSNG